MIEPVSNQAIAPVSTALGRSSPTNHTGSAQAFRALLTAGRKPDAADPQTVRQAAAQVLAELFFVPLLSEMREFPFGRKLTGEGAVERVFGPQLDQRIADTVAAADTGIQRQIVRQLTKTAPAATRTAAPAEPALRGEA